MNSMVTGDDGSGGETTLSQKDACGQPMTNASSRLARDNPTSAPARTSCHTPKEVANMLLLALHVQILIDLGGLW